MDHTQSVLFFLLLRRVSFLPSCFRLSSLLLFIQIFFLGGRDSSSSVDLNFELDNRAK